MISYCTSDIGIFSLRFLSVISYQYQPCVEINISLDIFDKYLSIYLFTKILRIFIYLFISKRSNNIQIYLINISL